MKMMMTKMKAREEDAGEVDAKKCAENNVKECEV